MVLRWAETWPLKQMKDRWFWNIKVRTVPTVFKLKSTTDDLRSGLSSERTIGRAVLDC